ncbi:MAG: rRNA maturation RNase YbeY [Candidatus Dormibacteraeota bacterium]|nr:rRNA maturation RNase YbeY [Candidatus Dormibacteraeota bacterium]
MHRAATLTASQRSTVAAAELGTLLREAGDRLGVATRASLAVRLTDDAELRALNRDFAGLDEPTDVLAFAGEQQHVGDVAISVRRALAQAPGGDGAAELRLLAVHGLLHCLGHDHGNPQAAATMTSLTRELLPGQPVPDL